MPVDDERLRVGSRLVVRVPPAGEVGRVGAVDRDLAVAEPVQAGPGLKVGRVNRALGQQGGRVRQTVAVRVAERGRGAGGGVLLQAGRPRTGIRPAGPRPLSPRPPGRRAGSVSSLPLIRTRRLNLYRTAAGGAAGMPDRGRRVSGTGGAGALVRRSSRANLPGAGTNSYRAWADPSSRDLLVGSFPRRWAMGLAFWSRAQADPGWTALIEPDGTARTAAPRAPGHRRAGRRLAAGRAGLLQPSASATTTRLRPPASRRTSRCRRVARANRATSRHPTSRARSTRSA